jgi:hypothetical protein
MTKQALIPSTLIVVAVIYNAYSFLTAEFERSHTASNAQEHIGLAQRLIAVKRPLLPKPAEDAINLAIESLQNELNRGDAATTEGIRSRDASLMALLTLWQKQPKSEAK